MGFSFSARAQEIGIATALEKIRPTGAAPQLTDRVVIEAARGEWEPFQIVIAGPRHKVTVEASALSAPSAANILAPRLYREALVPVAIPSNVEGEKGEWPDPLVPDVDAYVGQKRNAFPFDVPEGERRAVWGEVFVPRTATPGVYRGKLRIASAIAPDHVAAREIDLELTVHRFELPATSSLPVTFGISGNGLKKIHRDDSPALLARYSLSALRHRISLHGGSMEPPPPHGDEFDFAEYDRELAPFLDGTADSGGAAEGARFTAVDLRIDPKLPRAARTRYLAQVVRHFRERGWLDRLFAYVADEPKDVDLKKVRQDAEEIHRAAPEIARLVTRERRPELLGAVDIWCPIVNRVDDKPEGSGDADRPVPRSAYRKGRDRIWWYQACMSHGCDIVGGSYFTGWPSYVIDAPAIASRIFEWLTYRYDIGGELYYNTVEAYSAGINPWHGSHLHGGNGDGTLFYPGLPAEIGGSSEIPIESIRLKLIREGLEDYEYFKILERLRGREVAAAIVASIASKTYSWQHDPHRLLAARHEMAAMIDRALQEHR